MKISLKGAALTAVAASTFWVGSVQASCSHYTKNTCPTTRGCVVEGSGNNAVCVGTEKVTACTQYIDEDECAASALNGTLNCMYEDKGSSKGCSNYREISCADRKAKNFNQCEIDDKCVWNGGDKTCLPVPVGPGTQGATCLSKLVSDSVDGTYFVDDPTQACAAGFVCTLNSTYPSIDFGVSVQGFCQNTTCLGKRVPGNCNGNIANKEQCVATTSRVTICHRTCSRNNPWVRITIDEDAWNGEGCGHKQHNIEDECANKAPWAEWGAHRQDYEIKAHGTRADVAVGRNKNEIKAYWRKWEPACPYVRNGACCNWDIVDPNHKDYNPCCGTPDEFAEPAPLLDLTTYAGPVGECLYADSMVNMEDNLYELPTPDSQWQYCYVISVPNVTGAECLYNMKLTHPAPNAADGAVIEVTTQVNGKPAAYANDTTVCPGDVLYIPGGVRTGIPEGHHEGPIDAVVVAKGSESDLPVSASDPAKVTVDYSPAVIIQKWAGPWNECPNAANMSPLGGKLGGNMKDLIYDSPNTEYQYCYIVENVGNECILNAVMTDPNTGGLASYALGGAGGKLCPGQSVQFPGPSGLKTLVDLPPLVATVTGTGDRSGDAVSASNDAGVNVVEYQPSITITKRAGGVGECPFADSMSAYVSMVDDIYVTPDTKYQYCYVVTNTGNECLLNAVMKDDSIGGYTGPSTSGVGHTLGALGADNDATLFCPGDIEQIPGPAGMTTSVDLEKGMATVEGFGQYSNMKVTASNDAGVKVVNCTPMDNPGSSYCPSTETMSLGGVILADVQGAVKDASAIDMIYDISSSDGGASVTFKVDNPFAQSMNMYVQYHKPTLTNQGGWLEDCYHSAIGGCAPSTEAITADCIQGDGHPFTLVQVYFQDDSALAFAGGATLDECCPEPAGVSSSAIIAQYSFLLRCECPSTGRRLGETIDVEKIMALFGK